MRSVTMACIFGILCSLIMGSANAAWSWGKKPLMVIDGQEYSAEEYKAWWVYWRDSEEQKQESVQPFVNWMLMVREGERMDLASLPEYKHKVEVFVEARALMLLKRDEVDSKIALTEAELQAVYDRDFIPRRLVGMLEFSTMDEAMKFHGQFSGQAMTLERLQEMAGDQPKPLFVLQQPQWLRPVNTPAKWQPILDQAAAGVLRGPLPFNEKAAILFVAEVKAGDQEDYGKKKEVIQYDLRKQREQELTGQLVRDLMGKFRVRIDEQALEKINLTDPSANDREQVVITSDRSVVTVGYFLDQIRKETDITHKIPADADGQMMMKRRLANAMISNSVVSWEALSRRYEDKEPLAGAYQFYRQNRLAAEFENRAPGGDIQVTDAEVHAYYQEHQDEFRRPEMVRGVMVTGEEAVVRKVWAEAISGADLTKVAERNGATVAVSQANEFPFQHFSAVAQKVVAALKAGDMSQPFLDNGHSVVIKLIERKAGAAVPLEQVAQTVKDKIMNDKKAKRKQALIDALRSRATVVVNDDVWEAIVAGRD